MQILDTYDIQLLYYNGDKENLLKKAEKPGITLEEVNKLHGQAASITFEDIVACIEVSSCICKI